MDTIHQTPDSDEDLPARIRKFREVLDAEAERRGLPPESWAA